jgi:glycosyltransferase involved in cell wall biosynthesis
MMKILFINFAAEWGGGEGWTLRSAVGLYAKGHKVHIIGRENSPFVKRASETELHVSSLNVGIDYGPKNVLKIRSYLKRHIIEAVIVHHNKDVRIGGVAAKLSGVPVVHRNGFPVIHNNFRHKITSRFVDRILTNSSNIRDRYLSYKWMNRIPIDVVPNGIVFPQPNSLTRGFWTKQGVADNSLIAYYSGRLTQTKRVSTLIQAFNRLPEESRWILAIAGKGSEEKVLKDMVTEMKLDNKIKFIGFVENSSEIAAISDISVLPSADEGMPNALMEAMAQGVPVGATPVGDVPLLLDNGKVGLLLPLDDVNEWKNLFLKYENSPEIFQTFGLKGQDRIRSFFSFDKMIEGIEATLIAVTERL